MILVYIPYSKFPFPVPHTQVPMDRCKRNVDLNTFHCVHKQVHAVVDSKVVSPSQTTYSKSLTCSYNILSLTLNPQNSQHVCISDHDHLYCSPAMEFITNYWQSRLVMYSASRQDCNSLLQQLAHYLLNHSMSNSCGIVYCTGMRSVLD